MKEEYNKYSFFCVFLEKYLTKKHFCDKIKKTTKKGKNNEYKKRKNKH